MLTDALRVITAACAAILALSLGVPTAHAQITEAKGFQNGIPFDSWPTDPNNPIRRLFNDIPGDNGDLQWVASSHTPPPDGAPASAVLVSIRKFYFESCWVLPFTAQACCLVESGFDAVIICQGISGPSKYHYQYLSSEYRCVQADGSHETAISKSVLSTATVGSFNDVCVQSSFYQLLQGVVSSGSSNTAKVLVPPGVNNQLAPSLGTVAHKTKVEVVAAPGATLDLTGHDGAAPICVTAAPAIIRADPGAIHMDPGVTLNQLFVPPPQLLPAQTRAEVALAMTAYPRLQAPAPDAAVFSLVNLGNVPIPVNLVWSDTLGWTPPGSTIITLQPGDAQDFSIPLLYPPAGQPLDKTSLTLTATPLSTSASPVSLTQDVYFDSDLDGDGLKNCIDPCPTIFNGPSSPNADGDFFPDVCDPCPGVFNFVPDEPCPCGPGDFNGDGRTSVSDIFAFLGAWFAGYPGADFNGDGSITVTDIFNYLTAWFAGC